MIYHTKPRKQRRQFAFFPVRIDRPKTGGSVWLWLEPYTREVIPTSGGCDALIRTWVPRIRKGFEYVAPNYYIEY